MSHGPGAMQRQVLDAVAGRAEPLSLGTLCWRLAEQDAELEVGAAVAPGIPSGRVRPAFYKSFRRAVSGLIESGRIVRTRRKLASVDDALSFYPSKTLRIEARELRTRLLPTVLAYAARRMRVVDSSAIEEELLARRLDDEGHAETWAKEWEALREELASAYARASDSRDRDAILRLLAKGTRYFDRGSAMYLQMFGPRVCLVEDASLAELLKSAAATFAGPTFARLTHLYDDAIPGEQQQQRELKDLLFRVANFHKDTTPELNDETKMHLLEQVPSLITALPGHRAAPARRGFLALHAPHGPVFSTLLKEVLDRHVFGHFDFIQPSAS